jgi:hypothetical protein
MIVMGYRTQDGLADYGFSIEFQSNVGWRVYIVFDPFHQGHHHNVDLPYQAIDHGGRRYVDWSSKISNLGDAKTVAEVWAELTHRHQRTQEQHALYVKLIQQLTQKRTTPANPDRFDDPVGAGGTGLGYQDRGPTIPHARAPAKSLTDLQHRGQKGWSGHVDEVA